MSPLAELPPAARPLAEFAQLVRQFGFAVAPEQIISFMTAVRLLGPKGFADLRRAAYATLAPPPERHREFEALLQAFFAGAIAKTPVAAAGADERLRKGGRGPNFAEAVPAPGQSGRAASAAEQLSRRSFAEIASDRDLSLWARRAPQSLPRQRGFRRTAAKRGPTLDVRRTLRRVMMNDGEVLQLFMSRRRRRQRPVLLLIDISGSMKEHTGNALRFAHALTAAADKVETFTFGTRLTRITPALRLGDPARALEAAERRVADWDGGTRIGEALAAFLAVPRFLSYARGALCVVLSDGLERGDPSAMITAVRQLARRVWRLAWLTPLAADRRFRPQTTALKAILPYLDDFGEGGSLHSLCSYVLSAAQGGERWDAERWRRLAS